MFFIFPHTTKKGIVFIAQINNSNMRDGVKATAFTQTISSQISGFSIGGELCRMAESYESKHC